MYIPKKEIVEFLIRESLKDRKARSQKELSEILNQKLKSVDPDYSVTGKRVRSIAIDMPDVMIRVHTRSGSRPETCPSCGSELKKIYTKDLAGRDILSRMDCDTCGYSGRKDKWMPKRYEFWLETKTTS